MSWLWLSIVGCLRCSRLLEQQQQHQQEHRHREDSLFVGRSIEGADDGALVIECRHRAVRRNLHDLEPTLRDVVISIPPNRFFVYLSHSHLSHCFIHNHHVVECIKSMIDRLMSNTECVRVDPVSILRYSREVQGNELADR